MLSKRVFSLCTLIKMQKLILNKLCFLILNVQDASADYAKSNGKISLPALYIKQKEKYGTDTLLLLLFRFFNKYTDSTKINRPGHNIHM